MSRKSFSASDNIYASKQETIGEFSFNQQVVDVFPDMIQRSVPGYARIIDGIAELANHFVQENSIVYDLGCSLGAASLAVAKRTQDRTCNIIAIDNSEAMVERCKNHIGRYSFSKNINVQMADINEFSPQACSVIILNFTLQFISPDKRLGILKKLYDSLHKGGVLIMSEKLSHENEELENAIIDMHHRFKRQNGYSDLEIAQKRTALENVMLIDTQAEHHSRLSQAGFEYSSLWFKELNFASFVAIK